MPNRKNERLRQDRNQRVSPGGFLNLAKLGEESTIMNKAHVLLAAALLLLGISASQAREQLQPKQASPPPQETLPAPTPIAPGSKQTQPAPVDGAPARKAGKQHDWNNLEILAQGNHVRVAVNGTAVVDWRDPEPRRIKEGQIGLQLHANKEPQEVHFKDLVLTTFPEDKLTTLK